MRPIRSFHIRRGVVALMAAVVFLSLCLTACSDQVLDPGKDTLSIVDGTGAWGLVTEPSTGGQLNITPTDPFANAAHVLRVDFLNVDNADAILLRTEDAVILVDTGEADDYGAISGKLSEYGITAIDHLIITHYDNDHIGTATQILQNYTVRHVYMPDYVRDSRLYRSLVDRLDVMTANGEITVRRLTEAARIELANGSLTIYPTALYAHGQTLGSDDSHALEENNYSLITAVEFGDIRLLLAGDAEHDRITEFMATLPEGGTNFDLVKIPHHGAYDKSLGDLLRAAKGEIRYCVVSVGSADLVEASLVTAMRSAAAGAYYTYNGDIRFATDGATMTVEQG